MFGKAVLISFQCLENMARIFPMFGKFGVKFSKHWKRLEDLFPPEADKSKHWKKCRAGGLLSAGRAAELQRGPGFVPTKRWYSAVASEKENEDEKEKEEEKETESRAGER